MLQLLPWHSEERPHRGDPTDDPMKRRTATFRHPRPAPMNPVSEGTRTRPAKRAEARLGWVLGTTSTGTAPVTFGILSLSPSPASPSLHERDGLLKIS
jgi:hypothetical protein